MLIFMNGYYTWYFWVAIIMNINMNYDIGPLNILFREFKI